MARKQKPEEVSGKLREAEIALAQGGTVANKFHNETSALLCSTLTML